MVSADRVAGSLFFLLGLAAAIGGVRLDLGTPSEPQPGFYPFLAGILLMGLSVLLIVQDIRGRSDGAEPFLQLKAPLLALAGLVAFVALVRPLGYVPATAMLTVALLHVLEVRRLWVYLLAAIVVPIGTYLLFDRLLSIPLPSGPVDAWLAF
jgi:putative tricarboxylic transport membrane protein